MKINYHTHTWRCMHAEGAEADYVETAIRHGFDALGFSDHTPWPYKTGFVSGMRMRLDQFPDYARTVHDLQARFSGRIQILMGLECEAFPEYLSWLEEFKAQHLDYTLLGHHYDFNDETGGAYFGHCRSARQVRRYAEQVIAGMATGLFDCVAHPDLFMNTYRRFDEVCRGVSRDICQAARDLDIPLEYNLLGILKGGGYPCEDFWQLAAEAGCRAIVGYDAHFPGMLSRDDLYRQACEHLKALGIVRIEKLF